jgi:uncharacterized protein (TIGR03067 family)
MRCRWLLLLVAVLLVGADEPKKVPTDADRIQGVWQFESSERAGKKEITADTFRFHLPAGARHPQPYKLDPAKAPKTIDWLPDGKRGPTDPLPGIYALDGDTLKICWGPKGKDRPKEFKTTTDRDDWLWVLKRKKE